MNLRPLHDRIIVHRLEEGEQHIGGIIIPDSAKEKEGESGRKVADLYRPTASTSRRTPAGRRSMAGWS